VGRRASSWNLEVKLLVRPNLIAIIAKLYRDSDLMSLARPG